eukprot:m.210208 g.210208  ORF g.210208 m.210208 type:complete len:108 (+) comp15049_c2_seq1:2722-3045(+)
MRVFAIWVEVQSLNVRGCTQWSGAKEEIVCSVDDAVAVATLTVVVVVVVVVVAHQNVKANALHACTVIVDIIMCKRAFTNDGMHFAHACMCAVGDDKPLVWVSTGYV